MRMMDMRTRHKVMMLMAAWSVLFLAFSLDAGLLLKAQAQPPQIEFRCGTHFQETAVAGFPDFPGRYYHTQRIGVIDPEYVWEFEVITAEGEASLTTPFDRETATRVVFPQVSPDGNHMVFSPLDGNLLTVWNIQTGETTDFELSPELAAYLKTQEDYSSIIFNKLVWHSPTELWLQYFGTAMSAINPPLARVKLTVLDQPLSLVATTPADAIDLALNPPTSFDREAAYNAQFQQTINSPDGRFRLQTTKTQTLSFNSGRDIQIVDASTGRIVLHVKTTEDAIIFGDQIWSQDSRFLYYTERVPSGTKLAIFDAAQGFKRDTGLEAAFAGAFGRTNGGPTGTNPVLLSPDGVSVGFGFIDSENDYWMIRYNPSTGEAIAICDEAPSSSDIYPFWSPTNRFIAYWYNGTVKVYDFETGNRYRLPGTSFAGWIP